MSLKLRVVSPKYGMTLFEVMSAIIIFGTGILVLLSMIGSNISRLKTIRLKDNATILAKESMEIIYNMRDTNMEKKIYRNCGEFDPSEDDNCAFRIGAGGTGAMYRLEWMPEDTSDMPYMLAPIASIDEGRLYYHTGTKTLSGSTLDIFWYNHNASGARTPYTRFITMKPAPSYPGDTDKIIQVEVHVIADQGSKTYDVVLESMLGDIK